VDFTLTEEQTMLVDSVQRFVQQEYDFDTRQATVRRMGGFDRAHWTQFADMGWLGVALPEAVGGLGGSAADTALVMQELGRGLVVEPYLAVAVLAAQVIHAGASAAQQQDMLPALIGGERIVVLAHGEPDAAGAPAHVASHAAPDGDGGYRLYGGKSQILGGPVADQLIVSARTSGVTGDEHGISLFLLDAGAPGLARRDYRLLDGSGVSDIVLDGARVGPRALLGAAHGGYAAIDQGVSHATVALCAEAIGAMEKVIWTTRDYLRMRQQFGTAIGSFQALQHRMADMVCELEQSRAMLYRALAHLAAPDPAHRRHAVAAAKAQAGRSGKFVGAQGIQLHGGIGMTDEYCIGHYFKRLTVIDTLFGHQQFHLRALAKRYRAPDQETP
jgi:alkylation response protein AidB-like acyl-CoA dehydrogenase